MARQLASVFRKGLTSHFVIEVKEKAEELFLELLEDGEKEPWRLNTRLCTLLEQAHGRSKDVEKAMGFR